MKLLEFAQTLPEHFDESEFVENVNKVIDLKAVQNLSSLQRQALHDFAQYLADYMLLVKECIEGASTGPGGAPVLEYRGPYIENVLTRQDGRPLDRGQLDNFGVGVADDRFGDGGQVH